MTIGDVLEVRIAKTPTGMKAEVRDGRGLADGVYTKSYNRYFYGDDAEEKADQYADNKKEKLDDDVKIVRLGEQR